MDSGHVADDLGDLAVDLGHLASDSGNLADDLGNLADFAVLQRLAAPVASQGKVDSAVMVATIRALCAGRFLTAAHLAALLGRRRDGLRKRFLTPMVRDGLLRQKYQTATNRHDQAYTTAGEQ